MEIIHRELSKIVLDGQGLDVGCGRGFEVQYLRNAGLNILGVDIGFPRPCSEGMKEYLYLGKSAFDLPEKIKDNIQLFLFLDVLEHLEDPETFIENHLSSCPNVKWIFLTLPARQEIFSNYDIYNNHYKRYNLRECGKLFPHGKFISFRYFFHSLYIPAILLKLLRMKRGTRRAPPDTRAWLHKVLSKYFLLEYVLVPDSIFGSSLLAFIEI